MHPETIAVDQEFENISLWSVVKPGPGFELTEWLIDRPEEPL
jgi:hypothetical protein